MTVKEWAKGDVFEGRVASLDHSGAWIFIHEEKVFLPLSEIAWYEIEHPAEVMTVGEMVRVTITGKDKQGVYHCTLRQVREDDDEELVIEAVVEVPKGSRNKYELDPETGVYRLSRVIHPPMPSPVECGFVPNTLVDGGGRLGVLILVTEPTFPGCRIECRIVGVLRITNESGRDNKLLAVPIKDPRFQDIFTLSEVPNHTLKEIIHFLKVSREIEGKGTHTAGWLREMEAKKIYLDSKERFDQAGGGH